MENKISYLIGYFEDGQFWSVDETTSLTKASNTLEKQKQLLPKKYNCIVKKQISFEVLNEDWCVDAHKII